MDAWPNESLNLLDEKFPREAFERLGYNVAVHGQKTYNGVALLSKTPLEDVRRGLPDGDGDDHARYIEAVISGPQAGARGLASTCPTAIRSAPRNSPTSSPGWTGCTAHARNLLALEEPLVADRATTTSFPSPRRRAYPQDWVGDALFQPETRGALPGAEEPRPAPTPICRPTARPDAYTFWDYQAGAWQRNNGIRIDHVLLSPQAADRLTGVAIHRDVRELGEALRPRAVDDRADFVIRAWPRANALLNSAPPAAQSAYRRRMLAQPRPAPGGVAAAVWRPWPPLVAWCNAASSGRRTRRAHPPCARGATPTPRSSPPGPRPRRRFPPRPHRPWLVAVGRAARAP